MNSLRVQVKALESILNYIKVSQEYNRQDDRPYVVEGFGLVSECGLFGECGLFYV
jgi:hypothetical protein